MPSSAKITRSEDIVSTHVESKVQNVSSVIDHTKVSTTIILPGAAKWTSRWTLQGSKQSKGNYVLILSSVQIVRVIIKQTLIYVHSRNISSTESGT